MDEYYQVVQALPQWLARPLGQLPSEDAETVHELRLRLGCAPQFTVQGCSCTPTQLAPELNALQTMQLTPLQMEEILFTLCGGSVHTHQVEIAQGYVTLENGCRAGLGGRFCKTQERGHGSAGAHLCQPAHCPGKDRSASTGTDRSIAGAFHRDASCWRAGQRQDHIAAQYCPGARPAAEDPFGH